MLRTCINPPFIQASVTVSREAIVGEARHLGGIAATVRILPVLLQHPGVIIIIIKVIIII